MRSVLTTATPSTFFRTALTIEKARHVIACIDAGEPVHPDLLSFFTWDKLLEPRAHARVVAALPVPG